MSHKLPKNETYYLVTLEHAMGWPTTPERMTREELEAFLSAPDMTDQTIVEVRRYEATSEDVTSTFLVPAAA